MQKSIPMLQWMTLLLIVVFFENSLLKAEEPPTAVSESLCKGLSHLVGHLGAANPMLEFYKSNRAKILNLLENDTEELPAALNEHIAKYSLDVKKALKSNEYGEAPSFGDKAAELHADDLSNLNDKILNFIQGYEFIASEVSTTNPTLALKMKIVNELKTEVQLARGEASHTMGTALAAAGGADDAVGSALKKDDLRYLVVDDEGTNHRLMDRILTNQLKIPKDNVTKAFNGNEAVSQVLEHKPNIVFMDISMPLKSGDVATREIRVDSRVSPKPYIIAITANAKDLSPDQVSLFDQVFAKPIDKKKIEQAINDYLAMANAATVSEAACETLSHPAASSHPDSPRTGKEVVAPADKSSEAAPRSKDGVSE